MEQNPNSLSDTRRIAIRSKLDRPIVLVGLMGVGKSTIGKRLASDLGISFVDADEEIEKAAQLRINEIFDRFGEDYFREGERRVLARLLDGRPRVIATGGGAFMNDATRALVLGDAIAIWLDSDIETLAERVSRRNTRPLLRNKSPHQVLTDLAAERNPVYAQSPIHIKSDKGPHWQTVDRILGALEKWNG